MARCISVDAAVRRPPGRSDDPMERARSLKVLAATYWKPIYKYVRLRWRKEPAEAEEVTREFFLRAVDRAIFKNYEPAQARFRTFVRACVDHLMIDRDGRAQKCAAVAR